VVFPGERERIPLGFALELPEDYEAIIRPRSGMTSKGIDVAIGTIDSDYRGEVCACVINNTSQRIKINNGDRICQMKIQKSEKFTLVKKDTLSSTVRGNNGFGSTGR
jgi:dUTP pyrophosphatase